MLKHVSSISHVPGSGQVLDICCLSLSSEVFQEEEESGTSAFQMQSLRLGNEGVGLELVPSPPAPNHFMLLVASELSSTYLYSTPHTQAPGNVHLKSYLHLLLPIPTGTRPGRHYVKAACSGLSPLLPVCPPQPQCDPKCKTDHILTELCQHLKCFLWPQPTFLVSQPHCIHITPTCFLKAKSHSPGWVSIKAAHGSLNK